MRKLERSTVERTVKEQTSNDEMSAVTELLDTRRIFAIILLSFCAFIIRAALH